MDGTERALTLSMSPGSWLVLADYCADQGRDDLEIRWRRLAQVRERVVAALGTVAHHRSRYWEHLAIFGRVHLRTWRAARMLIARVESTAPGWVVGKKVAHHFLDAKLIQTYCPPQNGLPFMVPADNADRDGERVARMVLKLCRAILDSEGMA